MPLVLLANLVLTLLLTGLIWTVQIVHYPLFSAVGGAELGAYAQAHGGRIGLLVVPLMALELVAAGWLALRPPAGVPAGVTWAALGLVGLVWVVTAVIFVPLHGRLAASPAPGDLGLLVTANWIRTGAWTARAGLLVWLAARAG